ncbi:dipeptide epimerase [Taibaiella sp. KBW10]|nr:dipeptide epimerase [Taibaiella sp. KBW10]
MQLTYQRHSFPFQYPFQISKGIKTHQESLTITLGIAALKGYGEATAITYHGVTVEGMVALLEAKRMMIAQYTLTTPDRFWHFLHHLIPGEHFLTSALDMAAWDLYGQMRRMPVYKLLGLAWQNVPLTDYTIGITTPAEAADRIKAHPWPVYKLKLGSRQDMEVIRAVRAATDAVIRIDANEGWNVEDAKALLPELQQIGVELIEQPLDKADLEGMKVLKELTHIPIIADEACQGEKDLVICADLYDGINIKLSKCSGITPALELIKKAKASGLKIMLGSMNEGIVGASALSHLLPLADYADIDGPLLSEDTTGMTGIRYENGHILQPQGTGFGLKPA